MKENNNKKDELLGMSHGTASNQLRKMILFSLIQELNKDVCFRCGNKIERIEDLSIEHKEAWQSAENPKKSFFDLGNITFSHLNCNISAGYRNEKINFPNETGFKGVRKVKRNLKKPYSASIWKNQKQTHLGYFKTPEEASKTYNDALEK